MRDRLIGLIEQGRTNYFRDNRTTICESIADYLLAKGVIVPPCKVGDTVYFLHYGEILEATVISVEVNYYTNPQLWLTIEYYTKSFGRNSYKSRIDLMLNKTVFLTKEEAERALKSSKSICDYTKTDWNDCCDCSAKDYCDKYNERSEIIGEMLGEVIGEIKNEGR